MARLLDTVGTVGTLRDALDLVSLETGITAAALRSAYHRSREGTPRAHGASLLELHQQEVLVRLSQAFGLNNLPLTNSQLRAVIKRRWDVDVSPPWVSRWVKRNRHHHSLRV